MGRVSGKKCLFVLQIIIRTDNILNILSIWANKNGDKWAILNLILTTLSRIHGRIVINACVKYRKKIFIGVGDIHLDGQISNGRTADGAKIIIPLKKNIFCRSNFVNHINSIKFNKKLNLKVLCCTGMVSKKYLNNTCLKKPKITLLTGEILENVYKPIRKPL